MAAHFAFLAFHLLVAVFGPWHVAWLGCGMEPWIGSWDGALVWSLDGAAAWPGRSAEAWRLLVIMPHRSSLQRRRARLICHAVLPLTPPEVAVSTPLAASPRLAAASPRLAATSPRLSPPLAAAATRRLPPPLAASPLFAAASPRLETPVASSPLAAEEALRLSRPPPQPQPRPRQVRLEGDRAWWQAQRQLGRRLDVWQVQLQQLRAPRHLLQVQRPEGSRRGPRPQPQPAALARAPARPQPQPARRLSQVHAGEALVRVAHL